MGEKSAHLAREHVPSRRATRKPLRLRSSHPGVSPVPAAAFKTPSRSTEPAPRCFAVDLAERSSRTRAPLVPFPRRAHRGPATERLRASRRAPRLRRGLVSSLGCGADPSPEPPPSTTLSPARPDEMPDVPPGGGSSVESPPGACSSSAASVAAACASPWPAPGAPASASVSGASPGGGGPSSGTVVSGVSSRPSVASASSAPSSSGPWLPLVSPCSSSVAPSSGMLQRRQGRRGGRVGKGAGGCGELGSGQAHAPRSPHR